MYSARSWRRDAIEKLIAESELKDLGIHTELLVNAISICTRQVR